MFTVKAFSRISSIFLIITVSLFALAHPASGLAASAPSPKKQATSPILQPERILDTTPNETSHLQTDQIIIRYKASIGALAAQAGQIQSLSQIAGTSLQYQRAMSGDAHVLRLPEKLPLGQVQTITARLMTSPDVEYAEPDQMMFPTSDSQGIAPAPALRPSLLTPNDPLYTNQWHYYETWGINAPAAWNITTGSASLVVAVIDTGITNHVEFVGRTVPGYDFVSDTLKANDGDGRDSNPSDPGDWITPAENASGYFANCQIRNSTWHGTHTAGTIGAAGNNGVGVVGVNWNSKILPVRVLGKCGGYTSDIADGMRWAAGLAVSGIPTNANPAKVLNLSLGGSSACGTTFQSAIDAITAFGAVVVVSAGNDNADASTYHFAGCNGVIAVAATDRNGNRAPYSNYGAAVDISAPGGDVSISFTNGVASTLNTGTQGPMADAYAYYDGTSMAAPHVSGVVSLMLSLNPALTPAQVLQILQSTVKAFPVAGTCTTSNCGSGIVNAAAAVAYVAGISTPTPTRTPVASGNDDFGSPQVIISLPYSNTQDTSTATTVADDPTICTGSTRYNTVWYRYTAAASSTVQVDTIGSNYDTVLAVWTGSRGSLASVVCNDDDATSSPQSKVTFAATAGVTYYFEAASFLSGGGALTLHVTNGSTNTLTRTPTTSGPTPTATITPTPTMTVPSTFTPIPTFTRTPTQAAVAQIVVNPSALDATVLLGNSITIPITISNTGSGPATFELQETAGSFTATQLGQSLPYAHQSVQSLNQADTAPSGLQIAPAGIRGGGASIPTGERYRAAGASCNGQDYYIFGGWQNNAVLDESWEYNPSADTWTQMTDMPVALANMEATCLNGLIYLVGGFTGSALTNDFLIYNVASNTWTSSTWPNASAPMTAAWNDKLYTFGGDGISNQTWRYDPSNATWSGPLAFMPTATHYGSATTVGDHIFVVGGISDNDIPLGAVQRYNPANNTWDISGPALPNGRMSPIAVWYGNRLYVVNGGGAKTGFIWKPYSDALTIDPTLWPGGSWTPSTTMAVPVTASAYECVNNRIYSAGGSSEIAKYDITQYIDDDQTCHFDTSSDTPWLSENPTTGTIPAGGNQVINVSLNASALTQTGKYDTTLHILSNDPLNSDIAIPVTMRVAAENPAPTTTGLSPSSASTGRTAFTLTVNGTNFINSSIVYWNGSSRVTTYVSGTQLKAAISAADLTAAGTASVTVFNGAPGGGESNAQTFTVTLMTPTPTLTITPTPTPTFTPTTRVPVCTNLLADPSFETGTPWTVASTNFGSPLCTVAKCGTSSAIGPNTGNAWGWFGGTSDPENASLAQTITIPSGTATLKFYFWVGAADSGSGPDDFFNAQIDSTTLFSADASQIASYPGYTLVSANANAFADGGSHTVRFASSTAGQAVSFNLDDVALCSVGAATPTFTPTSVIRLTSTPTPGVTTLLSEAFEGNFPPSGWVTEKVVGTSGSWAQAANTIHPSGGSPHSGTHLAYFNSYDADVGDAARLYTPNLDFGATGLPYLLSFWMYHEEQFNATKDYLQVEVNSGSGWANIGSAIYRSNGTQGWTKHTINLSAYTGKVIRVSLKGVSAYGNNIHIDDVVILRTPSTPTPTPTKTKTLTPTTVSKVVTFLSVGVQDGWVLESAENSNVGGTLNATAITFNLGDDAAKKQYRGIMSFSTGSLPDNAVITQAILKIKQQAIVGGGNPVTTFQGFMVDIKTGFFDTYAALQPLDFQAVANKTLGPASPALVSGFYNINLFNGSTYINKLSTNLGLTQIRLRFKLDDNNNAIANYLSLFSGDAPAASRPQLVITYIVP